MAYIASMVRKVFQTTDCSFALWIAQFTCLYHICWGGLKHSKEFVYTFPWPVCRHLWCTHHYFLKCKHTRGSKHFCTRRILPAPLYAAVPQFVILHIFLHFCGYYTNVFHSFASGFDRPSVSSPIGDPKLFLVCLNCELNGRQCVKFDTKLSQSEPAAAMMRSPRIQALRMCNWKPVK